MTARPGGPRGTHASQSAEEWLCAQTVRVRVRTRGAGVHGHDAEELLVHFEPSAAAAVSVFARTRQWASHTFRTRTVRSCRAWPRSPRCTCTSCQPSRKWCRRCGSQRSRRCCAAGQRTTSPTRTRVKPAASSLRNPHLPESPPPWPGLRWECSCTVPVRVIISPAADSARSARAPVEAELGNEQRVRGDDAVAREEVAGRRAAVDLVGPHVHSVVGVRDDRQAVPGCAHGW
jgi:hypothetical protein